MKKYEIMSKIEHPPFIPEISPPVQKLVTLLALIAANCLAAKVEDIIKELLDHDEHFGDIKYEEDE